MFSDFVMMIIVGLAALLAIGTLSIMHVLMVPRNLAPRRRDKHAPAADAVAVDADAVENPEDLTDTR